MLEMPDNLTPTEQAIFYVTQYPCPHCLLPKCSTDAQRDYFVGLQKIQNLISDCWTAYCNGWADPLLPALKSKAIPRDIHEWVWLNVYYLDALWKLCQVLAPSLADSFQEVVNHEASVYEATALYLFRAAVMEKNNWHIEATFGYITGGGRVADAALKLKAKTLRGEVLTQEETKRWAKLAKRGHKSNVLDLLGRAAILEFKNKNVAIQFRNFKLATADLFKREATIARKGGGYGWDRGIPLKATEGSVYVPDIS
ncbi:hypothetical protein [Microcoleus sp. S13_C5]|uniref:hypothetical protein n=1 Tax=Microcoleus sp. S13_C5 TaxID=3055411 RepID=UPI002FD23AD9